MIIVTVALRVVLYFNVYRTSMVAICQLLLYCVTNGNKDLCNMMVEGEEMRSHGLSVGVLTRSKKAQGELVMSY